MPLQLNTIEEYDFQHGFHRNYVTGKYIAIQPHDLGRPLTHAEMDYNLILNEQTQAGFRIFGSNEDLTLSDDDLGSSLVFHKISADDDDFARYQSKGYSVGQYIWILDCCAPKFNCALFVVDSITATDSGVCSFVVDSITATPEDPCISFVVDTICSFEVESIEFQNSGSDDVLPTPTPTATEVIEPTPTPTATDLLDGYYTYYMTTPIEKLPYPNNQSAQDLYCAPGETITTVVKHISGNVLSMGNAAFFNPDGTPYTLLNADPGVQYHVLIFRADKFADRNYDIGSNTADLDLRRSGGQYGGHLMLHTDTVPGPGGYLGNVTGAVPLAAAQGWWNEDCPAVPVTPTPTATEVIEPTPTATEVIEPTPTPSMTPIQGTSNLTFDYHVPLTLDGYTYELQKPNGDFFGYYEDASWTVSNPVYWGHELFAEPLGGHQWTSDNQLVFEVDGNQIVPDGTIQNNISIVTQIESDGRLSILTKSHNINENRVHEIRITGGPELVDPSITIDPPVQRPMLGLNAYTAWTDLVAQWEQDNPNCQYDPNFDYVTGSFLQDKLGVTNAEMFGWGLGTSGRIRFMLRVLSETQPLDMALLNEFGQSGFSGCLITPTPTPTVETVTDRYNMSVTPPTAEETSAGNQYMQFNIQAINGYNPPAGTTVGYTITGDWEFTDIQVIGTNIGDGNNVSEPFPLIESPENPYSNVFRIGEQGSTLKTAAIRVYVTNDANIEGLEQVTVTLASEDSLGNSTSSTEVSATGEIIDVTPTPTATEVPPTATPEPTATPMATPITEMSIPHKLIVATSVYNMIFEDVSAYMLVVNNDDPIWYGGPDYSQYDINSGIYTHPDAQMLGKVPVPSCVPDGDKAELLSTINITDRGYGLEYEVSNTRVYVWFKDDNGHVYGVRDGLCYPVQNQHVHMWGMNYGSLIDILNNGQTLETSYTISDSSMVS
jgi:hypothetical protein